MRARACGGGFGGSVLGACLVTILAVVLSGASPETAAAQSLIPEKGLEFGTLQPGVPRSVSPDHPDRAALAIDARGHIGILVITPTALVSSEGRSIPLLFQPGAAVARWHDGSEQALTIGSTVRATGRLTGTIYIGGTALPAWDQPAGTYTASIVVQIVPSGT